MNNFIKTLLAGAALGALATAQAAANNAPNLHVTALYAGHVVNKTRIHEPGRQHITYTYSISTYVPASDLGQTVPLGTFYKWNSNDTVCSNPKQKIKVVPKKTKYAKIGTATQTYSLGCSSGPTVFYGDTYHLFNKAGEGQTDHFESILKGKFEQQGLKYEGRLILDVSVAIGE